MPPNNEIVWDDEVDGAGPLTSRPKPPMADIVWDDVPPLPEGTTEIHIGRPPPSLPMENDIPLTGGFLKYGDITRGIGQGVGAGIGLPFAGPTMGLSVPAGAAGGNVAMERVNGILNALLSDELTLDDTLLPEGEDELVGEAGEGAVGGVLDMTLGPLIKKVGGLFSKSGKAVEPLGSRIGESRFKDVAKKQGAEALDPNWGKTIKQGGVDSEMIKALQINMGDLSAREQASAIDTIALAQREGYFNDVGSLTDLQTKVNKDATTFEYVQERLPDDGTEVGRVIDSERLVPGRMQNAEQAAADALVDEQDRLLSEGVGLPNAVSGKNVPKNFDDIVGEVENRLVNYYEKNSGSVDLKDISAVIDQEIMPKLQNEFDLSNDFSLKNIHRLRKAWDDKADAAFRGTTPNGRVRLADGTEVDGALKGTLEKEIANTLRNIEETIAEAIDPKLASDFKIAKNKTRQVNKLYDLLNKPALRSAKANSGVANSVKNIMPTTPMQMFNRALFGKTLPEDAAFARSQGAAVAKSAEAMRLARTPEERAAAAAMDVTAPINAGDMNLTARVGNLLSTKGIASIPGRLVEGGLKGAGGILKSDVLPDIAQAGGARNMVEQIPNVLSAISINRSQEPQPFPRNTTTVVQNKEMFLATLAGIASQPQLAEERSVPPQILHNRALGIVRDTEQILNSNNNAQIAETMSALSKMFPDLFEQGYSSQWDGMIYDPTEKGYFLKDLKIKAERGEVQPSFLAQQTSEMNATGKILQQPQQPTQGQPKQPNQKVQTSVGRRRSYSY